MVQVLHSVTITQHSVGGEQLRMLEGVTSIDEEYIRRQKDELMRGQLLRMEVSLREVVGELLSLRNDVQALKERVKDAEDREKARSMGIQVKEPRR